MMDSARYWLGIGAAPAPVKKPNAVVERRKKAASEVPLEKRLASITRAQELQLEQRQDELEEVEQELQAALKKKDTATAKLKLKRKNELKAEITSIGGKHANTRAQLNVQQTANNNLEQALLVQEGATELKGAVEAIEEIKLEDAIDDIKDRAAELKVHDDLLSSSMFGDLTGVNEEDVDEELAAMMRQQEEERIAAQLEQMGSVPTTLPVPLKPTLTPAAAKEKEEELQNTKE